MSDRSREPGQERGEVERAGVVAGVLVISSGQAAPLLEQAEAAFDGAAAGVAGRVEADRAAARGTLAAPVGLLVTRLGDGVGDLARLL